MKRLVLIFLIAGNGCAAASPRPPPLPSLQAVEVLPPVQAPEPAALAGPIASVAQQYQQTARKEVKAVTAPDVTVEYIRAVHTADLHARRALGILEEQGRHATPEALGRARAAVRRLADILDGVS